MRLVPPRTKTSPSLHIGKLTVDSLKELETQKDFTIDFKNRQLVEMVTAEADLKDAVYYHATQLYQMAASARGKSIP